MTDLMKTFGVILTYARDYATPLALAGLVTAAGWCVHERDNRIRQEAVHKVTVERFVVRDSAREVQARETAARDSARADSIADLSALLDSAEARARVAERGVDEASERAVEAGEDIRASIDSVAILDPGLGRTMRRQLSDHLEADREVLAAVEGERDAHQSVAETLREQRDLWRNRWNDERRLRLTTEDALDEAREALEVRVPEEGTSWGERVLWAGAGVGVGALVVAVTGGT